MYSSNFFTCDLQYFRTDSWKNLSWVLLIFLVITFKKKKKIIPPTNLKFLCCLPAGHCKWKHFHREKTDQNTFHSWQMQMKTAIRANDLVGKEYHNQEKEAFEVHCFKTEVEKGVKLQYHRMRELGHMELAPDQGWVGNWHSIERNQSPSNLKLFTSQTNLLRRQRQPGEGVLAQEEKKTHPTHPIPILLLCFFPHHFISANMLPLCKGM